MMNRFKKENVVKPGTVGPNDVIAYSYMEKNILFKNPFAIL